MIFDHYAGFEGEPEITFRTADRRCVVTMWNGYFTSIIRNAAVNNQGYWKPLALLYHTSTGWEASSPFELTGIDEVVAELMELLPSYQDTDTLAAYQELLHVFHFASKHKESIWVDYS